MNEQRYHSTLRSFDIARIAAMSLVALQHLLSVPNKQGPILLGDLDLGQLGVAIFCALSGYFSIRSSPESNVRWIARRLRRIFIPYWITLVAIFVANEITQYKPSSVGLIISEFLGIGLFTHHYSLVGVHAWFISLILLCYLMALALRWSRRCFPLLFVLSFATASWDSLVAAHLISFLSGCLLAEKRAESPKWIAVGIAVACIVAVSILSIRFSYPLASISVILVCAYFTNSSSRRLSAISNATYEFYLVHGPIYLGLAVYAGLGVLANFLVGTTLSIFAAVLLREASNRVLLIGERMNISMKGWKPNKAEFDSPTPSFSGQHFDNVEAAMRTNKKFLRDDVRLK